MTTPTTSHRPADLPPGSALTLPEPAPVTVPPLPADLVALPAGHRACYACGVAVPRLGGGEAITAEVTMQDGRTLTDLQTGSRAVLERVALLTCPDCEARERAAADLVAEHPNLAQRLGHGRARQRTLAALDALAVIGQPVPTLTGENAALSLVAAVHRADAVAVTWLALLNDNAPGDTAVCSPHPWAHVSDADRAALRGAYAAHLAERAALNAPPVALPPPTPATGNGAAAIPGGCMFCGVGALVLPAAEVVARGGAQRASAEKWTPRRVSADALGTGGPTLSGHLCPPCDRATTEVGSIGGTAMDRALRAHLLAAGRDDDARWIVEGETYGIRGWAALVYRARRTSRPEPRANAEPWAHVVVTAEVRALPVPEWEEEEEEEAPPPPAEPEPAPEPRRRRVPQRTKPKAKAKRVRTPQPPAPPAPPPPPPAVPEHRHAQHRTPEGFTRF